jgi:hypothetical protein
MSQVGWANVFWFAHRSAIWWATVKRVAHPTWLDKNNNNRYSIQASITIKLLILKTTPK